jgi:hypothetical protein
VNLAAALPLASERRRSMAGGGDGAPGRRATGPWQQAPGPFSVAKLAIGGAGIAVVAVGQYAWSAGVHALGIALVSLGGIAVASVLARAAFLGLRGDRK